MIKLIPALFIVAALSACGSSDPSTVASVASSEPSMSATTMPMPSAAAANCTKVAASVPAAATATKSLVTKPVITIPAAAAPCDLQTSDIVTGTGPAAKAGDALTVKYVGALYSDGKEFDSSWSRGADQTFPFQLGAGAVIKGWDTGVAGMKVGGRRELTIPADLGYGAQGQGSIPAGATLVFIVDLVKIGA